MLLNNNIIIWKIINIIKGNAINIIRENIYTYTYIYMICVCVY